MTISSSMTGLSGLGDVCALNLDKLALRVLSGVVNRDSVVFV